MKTKQKDITNFLSFKAPGESINGTSLIKSSIIVRVFNKYLADFSLHNLLADTIKTTLQPFQ